jgi:hypothetical protein
MTPHLYFCQAASVAIHMDPMSDVMMTQEHLTAHQCQAMALFELGSAKFRNLAITDSGQNSHCIHP